MTHEGQHSGCTQCFPIKLRSINFQSAQTTDTNKADAQLRKDLDAYKRLRRNGVQPPHTDGSALLEAKCNEKVEVERATLMSRPIRQEIAARTADMPAPAALAKGKP